MPIEGGMSELRFAPVILAGGSGTRFWPRSRRARAKQVVKLAASGDKIVVLGVPPTRAETGYGYIEQGAVVDAASALCGGIPTRRVKRFTEKPDRARAEEFVASGDFAWNSGMFLWSARTL